MDRIGTGTLAVEVAEDRGHVSICSAGRLEDGRVQVELVAYLTRTGGVVERVVEFRGRWTVTAVVVDPLGGASNLRQPLRAQYVPVVEPDVAGVKVAHADFLDLANADPPGLAVVASETLTTAIQHLAARTVGGQPVFDRRGAPVDVSPAVAAELAVWALLHPPPRPQPFMAVWR
jgi:hypothetical protein